MSLETLLQQYGLLGLYIGSAIEGEMVALIGGILAHRGVFSLPAAALALAAGSFTNDQLLYWAGRRVGRTQRYARLAAKPPAKRAIALLERHPIPFLLSFRFFWGMRTVSPLVIAASQVSVRLYLACNLVAAAIWGPIFAALGYVLGAAITRTVGRIERIEHLLLLAVPAALLVVLVHRLLAARRAPTSPR